MCVKSMFYWKKEKSVKTKIVVYMYVCLSHSEEFIQFYAKNYLRNFLNITPKM